MATLLFGVKLLKTVLANNGAALTANGTSFCAPTALSAWMVLLISVVSLATSLRRALLRRDLADAVVANGASEEFYVLTPLFATGMCLVVLANNLGVMWIAVEATARLCSWWR